MPPHPSNQTPHAANIAYLEALWQQFERDPSTVSDDWRAFFAALSADRNDEGDGMDPAPSALSDIQKKKQASVLQLINAARFRGHRQADLDPLRQYHRPPVPELDLSYYNFSEQDMTTRFNTGSLQGPKEETLANIHARLQDIYCGTIGAEYMHINETEQKRWIQERLENPRPAPEPEFQKRLLRQLIATHTLEEYLHTRYVGQKRFSLEGGEGVIPLLQQLVEDAATRRAEEMVIGMAHRGRLNVLVNVLGKKPEDLFDEFEGRMMEKQGSGDVKYHKGYSSDVRINGHELHLTLAFNPSHLEIIDPVVVGSVRARQEHRNDKQRNQVIPVLLHGDAAFAGQGVVMETFNLSQTRGYSVGGTVHIVINNQIGFTTSDPLDSRSTLYCTDIAKMVQAPIFHVNGDDPEAITFIARLAMEYRAEFHKDVIIDMVCYRRHGHSETDEPSVTQPIMYQHIRKRQPANEIYADHLLQRQVIDENEPERMREEYISLLEKGTCVVPTVSPENESDGNPFRIDFSRYLIDHEWRTPVETRLPADEIKRLGEALCRLPEGFKIHQSVRRIMDNRKKMAADELNADWGWAETLAYASLLIAGYPVRLSGQDSGRGTFFHRHAILHHQETGETYLPLQHVSDRQAYYLVINSVLSEEAILGFEFGYSCASPEDLVIWEAQFGDFANGAQVVFDQFISSCEVKWRRLCGLTVLLPHGYDGQGPEHSSARLERWLQLAAEENIQVCVPSVAAQMFHLLRRQILRPIRKPLIIMSPKSMLRLPASSSPLADFTENDMRVIIDDDYVPNKIAVRRVLLCCGKLYYDLHKGRSQAERNDVAIIRIEQLYPFPLSELQEVIGLYPNTDEIIWVQEEPKNQGAWEFIQSERAMGRHKWHRPLLYIGRPAAAAPAGGSMNEHLEQQKDLIAQALSPIREKTIRAVDGKQTSLPLGADNDPSQKQAGDNV